MFDIFKKPNLPTLMSFCPTQSILTLQSNSRRLSMSESVWFISDDFIYRNVIFKQLLKSNANTL